MNSLYKRQVIFLECKRSFFAERVYYAFFDVHDLPVENDLSDYTIREAAQCDLELNQKMRRLLAKRKSYNYGYRWKFVGQITAANKGLLPSLNKPDLVKVILERRLSYCRCCKRSGCSNLQEWALSLEDFKRARAQLARTAGTAEAEQPPGYPAGEPSADGPTKGAREASIAAPPCDAQ